MGSLNDITADDPVLVRVNDALCRISRQHVLQVSRFCLEAGQHWCVYGGNGSGKTLLAKLLRGELVSGRSHLSWAPGFDPHRDIFTVSFEQQQRLQELDQRHDISEYSADAVDQGTTVQQLILSSRPGPAEGLETDPEYWRLLDLLDLEPLKHRGIRYLSSGQTRKVMIARALFAAASGRRVLLILDNPLESIDRESRDHIRAALAQAGESATLLLLSRRVRDILPATTHLALMENLRLVEQGDIQSVQTGEHWRRLTRIDVDPPEQLPRPPSGGISAAPANTPLIQLEGVNASWGDKPVLRDIHWSMRSHHHTLIEGPNGCGKSTLLSLIDGDNHKAYGQPVSLFGRRRGSGESVWEIKSRFGVVSNELHNRYVRGWKVLEVVVSGFYDTVGLYDDSGGSERRSALEWLAAFHIEDLAGQSYHEISFGQQRLVLLARAMVKHPAVLILDEPCVGLDDRHRALILTTLDRIAATTATHIVYVSHTSGEEPACINQRLLFVPAPGGGYTLRDTGDATD